jgi:hypothetical protein
MASQDADNLSIANLALSDPPPSCPVCKDVMADGLIFWKRFVQGIEAGCAYCNMIIGAVMHFNLVSFVLNADEIAQLRNFRHLGAMYDAAGREVDMAIQVYSARHKETWNSLRINMSSYVSHISIQEGLFVSRNGSPIVQFYTPTGNIRFCHVQCFASTNSLWTAVPNVEVPFVPVLETILIHSASEECFDKVSAWIHECVSNHTTDSCPNEPKLLPKRVLLVPPTGDIKLYEASTAQKEKYICLSHCWGSSKNRAITTKENIASRKQGISWNELGKTYRDAVTICRALGFSHLWIDSLCIIQNDGRDWEEQAAQMASIYENAFLTIRASWSIDGDAGILSNRYIRNAPMSHWPWKEPYNTGIPTPDVNPKELDSTASSQSPVILARFMQEHHAKEVVRKQPDLRKTFESGPRSKQYEPLSTRAWVYQEYLMSSRSLSYYGTEMTWECGQMRRCECKYAQIIREKCIMTAAQEFGQLKILSMMYRLGLSNMGMGWSDIVKDYSRLQLTYESDRLPALSGLASRYSGLCSAKWRGSKSLISGPGGIYVPEDPQPPENLRLRYLAGIWEFELPVNLLWYRSHNLSSAAESTSTNRWRYDGKYRAPTWSWAAVVGPVDFMTISQEEDNSRIAVAQIEGIEYSIKGIDPHGDSASASMSLKSFTVTGELVWSDKQTPQVAVKNGANQKYVDIMLDFATSEDGVAVYKTALRQVHLFEIHRSTTNSRGLVLLQREDAGAFEKIGCFRLEEKYESRVYSANNIEGVENSRPIGGHVAIEGPEGNQTRSDIVSKSMFANVDRKSVVIF